MMLHLIKILIWRSLGQISWCLPRVQIYVKFSLSFATLEVSIQIRHIYHIW